MIKRISITGENGFLGSHLKSKFLGDKSFEYVPLGRNFGESISKLKTGDILIHAASVHRDIIPENVYRKNMEINEALISMLNKNNQYINIIFVSSIQESLDNPYGRSKKDGKLLFQNYCKLNNTLCISHRLPNIFGPGAKPESTSFVATFCYNIHNNIACKYNSNIVNLCYIEDAVEKIAKLSWDNVDFETTQTTVESVYFLLRRFKAVIDSGKRPVLSTNFDKNLLTTFLSYKNHEME
jgi:UDP-2-acetamido-2,6-beta-L-arabino-hexul-4-ose reductase